MDINDSLTRGGNPALTAGAVSSPGFVPHHREDVFTSSTPGATGISVLFVIKFVFLGSGLGQATVVNNTL